jgi:protein gp37
MGFESHIQWTDHTFNSWIGCTKVSAECDHCYAADLSRFRGWAQWGPGEPRRVLSKATWRQPLKWNRKCTELGIRQRVFCSSLADVFDAEAPAGQRDRLYQLIRETPSLDWLVLTKRPHLAPRYLPADWGNGYSNVWLGVTVGVRKSQWRFDALRKIPARVRFVSIEPLLEALPDLDLIGFHWAIVGGESGPGARPMDPEWAIAIIDQCKAAGVPVFFKQKGMVLARELGCRDRKGGDFDEFPPEFQIRQFPDAA